MHGFPISEKLGLFFFLPFFNFSIELGSQILHSTRDNVSQLGGMEWLQCLCVPILGPEGTDKTVLRPNDGCISGHSGGLSNELLS